MRLRRVAAILARGIGRLREASDDSVESPDEPARVSGNLADSLPKRLDGVAPPSLSVTDVSETTGFETNRDQNHCEVKDDE